ncbi:DUF1960-domain-containing protein [Mucidula mucida]|nr:DUF1960-domain-containing protein [Mucidula mucida]
MAKTISKVIYKPDSQSTDEYVVLVDTEEFKKWKAGGESIALALVVDSFDVLHSGQGPQGILGKPSKQQLDTIFGTSKEDEVVTKILQDGRLQSTEGVKSSFGTTNAARGRPSLTAEARERVDCKGFFHP